MLARRAITSVARQAASASTVRCLSTSTLLKKDFVQDLYLRELKGYKPKEIPANAHVGNVKEFHTPSAPKAPVVPSSAELAKELQAYESEEPSMASAKPTSESESEDAAPGQTADEYLAFVEREAKHVPSAAHH